MFSIKKIGKEFSASHFLPQHPKCGRIHGHNFKVEVEVQGQPDKHGMIVDFSDIKKQIDKLVDLIDHHLIIPTQNSMITIKKAEELIDKNIFDKNDYYWIMVGYDHYVLPKYVISLLPITNSTSEMLAKYFQTNLSNIFKQLSISVTVWETSDNCATYTSNNVLKEVDKMVDKINLSDKAIDVLDHIKEKTLYQEMGTDPTELQQFAKGVDDFDSLIDKLIDDGFLENDDDGYRITGEGINALEQAKESKKLKK